MQKREQFSKNGFVTIPQLFTKPEIKTLTEQVDRIYNLWFKKHATEVAEKGLLNMHSLTAPKYFEAQSGERVRFFESISPPKLTDILSELFGNGIYLHNTQLFFNPHKPRLPYWHRDMQYSALSDEVQKEEQTHMLSLHVRIPLLKESGVELIPGTHRRWDTELERDVRLELNGRKNSEVLPDAKLIHLESGDVLIFSAQMIHRGNYELNPARKALDLCVGKPHRLLAEFLDQTTLPTTEELELIQNKKWYDQSQTNRMIR